jgi:hypothetical protein
LGNLKGRDDLKELDIGRGIILKWTLRKYNRVIAWIHLADVRAH